MLRNMSIGARMSVLVLAAAGGVLCLIAGYGAHRSRLVLKDELEAKARALGAATAFHIEVVERSVAKTAEGLAMAVSALPLQPAEVDDLLRRVVETNAEVFGSAAAFEPGVFGPKDPGTAHYAMARSGGVVLKNLAEGGYAYETQDWYVLPKELKRPVWSEPYFDKGGGDILMATYSVPVWFRDGRFMGVVTCDVSLAWLSKELTSLPLGEQGYAFLISKIGTLIAHPTRQFIMNESIFSLAEERQDVALRDLGRRMIRGESGFVPFRSFTTRKDSYLAFSPIPSTGWSLGVVFYKDIITAKVNALGRTQLALSLMGILLLLVLVLWISRSITKPLKELDAATRVLASGDLDTPLTIPSGDDEVVHLSSSFEAMRLDLKKHMADLQATTAARERVSRELQIAHNIQMSLVPRTFPPFLGREDFEIFAVLDPAREIGGDLYDFLLLDPFHLCVIIGDVSGKGIPAALFMAVTRSFLRAFLREEPDPAAALARLNEELASQGDTNMFVTLFCTIIDLRTGEARFTNGGHNPPYLLRAGGALESVPLIGGIVVGAIPGMPYKSGAFQLAPGDVLVLYTDGVTEAEDQAGGFFGEERAEAELRTLQGRSAEELVRALRGKVAAFAEGAQQSDDITIMAFKYLGAK